MTARTELRNQRAKLQTMARGRADGIVAVAVLYGFTKQQAIELGEATGSERMDVHHAWLRAHDYTEDER